MEACFTSSSEEELICLSKIAPFSIPRAFWHSKRLFKQFGRNSSCQALANRGNMLPETFASDKCFPNVSHAGLPHRKLSFQQQNIFLLHGRNIFPCGKLGNMRPQQMFLATCFFVLPGLNLSIAKGENFDVVAEFNLFFKFVRHSLCSVDYIFIIV